ncbi:MBL fold metallo-hydrolase [Streptomyces sp. NPDC102451]|uniref:MBL fold metallo-hydrolase n=1 Tax=Streptomyces sp. NPDC102451 TaxID=3366177 RepID=UPI00381C1E87
MTMEITGSVQWQAWQDKVMPPVERVSDGLWSIPVPIPRNPLRYVLVYALECRDGLVLIDAGWDDDVSWLALTEGVRATGHDIKDVRAVLVTHHHADHLGLAGRVREASGAWVALHALDAAAARTTPSSAGGLAEDIRGHLELHGVPAGEARRTVGALDVGRSLDAPPADVLLEDGEAIRVPGLDLRVIWTPGHSPGHSCFYEPDRRLLFSGDHVLPRITPQIAVYAQTQGDPLADFLRSLERLDRFAVDEVLPAHEYRFKGLDERTAYMARHHTERLAELDACVGKKPGSTAWELSSQLVWSRPWDTFDTTSRRFALAETIAHLVLLRNRGTVHSADGHPVRWFPSAADRPEGRPARQDLPGAR